MQTKEMINFLETKQREVEVMFLKQVTYIEKKILKSYEFHQNLIDEIKKAPINRSLKNENQF